uniref:Uncharacterized protein n=1 Tax=Meloidogyne hapla TaxID=6305 RepID=A0A1I8C1E6_MELHA
MDYSIFSTSKKLFFNKSILLKNLRNIQNKNEFNDNLFEELYGFKFKKQINRKEIERKILKIIKKQPLINQELFKEKGLHATFLSLGIKSKKELFNEICNEFEIQLPLGEFDNIQNGLDFCNIICDLINSDN